MTRASTRTCQRPFAQTRHRLSQTGPVAVSEYPEPTVSTVKKLYARAFRCVNGQFLVPAGGQVEVPTLSRLLGRLQSGSSVLSGLLHAVGVTVGDDGVAVMQKPVEHADRGGVFG